MKVIFVLLLGAALCVASEKPKPGTADAWRTGTIASAERRPNWDGVKAVKYRITLPGAWIDVVDRAGSALHGYPQSLPVGTEVIIASPGNDFWYGATRVKVKIGGKLRKLYVEAESVR